MNSVVLNQKALSAEVFFAFSANRHVNGRIMQPCVSGTNFTWQIHPYGYYELDKPLPDKTKQMLDTVSYEISRDNIAFRAGIGDMVEYLTTQWKIFESKLVLKSIQEYNDSISPLFGCRAYEMSDLPEFRIGPTSVTVIIDVDSDRTNFTFGYYNFEKGEWDAQGFNQEDLEAAKWMYPPYNFEWLKKACDKNIS
jgi:hypothetical protein